MFIFISCRIQESRSDFTCQRTVSELDDEITTMAYMDEMLYYVLADDKHHVHRVHVDSGEHEHAFSIHPDLGINTLKHINTGTDDKYVLLPEKIHG